MIAPLASTIRSHLPASPSIDAPFASLTPSASLSIRSLDQLDSICARWPIAGESLPAGSQSPPFTFHPCFEHIFTDNSPPLSLSTSSFLSVRVDSSLRLYFDLDSMLNSATSPPPPHHVASQSNRFDLNVDDDSPQSQWWAACIRWARNCLEHNLTLHSIADRLHHYRLTIDHPVPVGQPLCVWPSADLLARHRIPIALLPNQILNPHQYACDRCGQIYSQPNLLRVHIASCASISRPDALPHLLQRTGISNGHSIQSLLARPASPDASVKKWPFLPDYSTATVTNRSSSVQLLRSAISSNSSCQTSTSAASVVEFERVASLFNWTSPALLQRHLQNRFASQSWSQSSDLQFNRGSSTSSADSHAVDLKSHSATTPTVVRSSVPHHSQPIDSHAARLSCDSPPSDQTVRFRHGHFRLSTVELGGYKISNSPDEPISDRVISSSNRTESVDMSDESMESAHESTEKPLKVTKEPRTHTCMFCGKLYTRKYGLKIHVRTHTGHKPLKCIHCSRAFSDPSNLNKHMRLHQQHRLWSKTLNLKKL